MFWELGKVSYFRRIHIKTFKIIKFSLFHFLRKCSISCLCTEEGGFPGGHRNKKEGHHGPGSSQLNS